MRSLIRENMLDISVGGGLLGAGGGGSVREGSKLVERILQFATSPPQTKSTTRPGGQS